MSMKLLIDRTSLARRRARETDVIEIYVKYIKATELETEAIV